MIQGRGRTILVDAGTGGFNGWGGRFPVALAAAGVEPDDVDTILLTHAHVDHVGGLTLHGQPLFPKAEVVVSEAEAGILARRRHHGFGAGARREALLRGGPHCLRRL